MLARGMVVVSIDASLRKVKSREALQQCKIPLRRPKMFFRCLFVFCGKDVFLETCFSDRRRKRSAISYFFGEDSFIKITLRPAARRHILVASSSTLFVVEDFKLSVENSQI